MRVRGHKSEAELNQGLVLPKFEIRQLRLIPKFYLCPARRQLKEAIRDALPPLPVWHLAPKAQAQRVRELALWMAWSYEVLNPTPLTFIPITRF
jgi:hypothetical protein